MIHLLFEGLRPEAVAARRARLAAVVAVALVVATASLALSLWSVLQPPVPSCEVRR